MDQPPPRAEGAAGATSGTDTPAEAQASEDGAADAGAGADGGGTAPAPAESEEPRDAAPSAAEPNPAEPRDAAPSAPPPSVAPPSPPAVPVAPPPLPPPPVPVVAPPPPPAAPPTAAGPVRDPARRPIGRPLRTAALWAAALLFGTTGGIVAGFQIQADRAATELAPLAQAGLGYPEEPAAHAAELPEEEDGRHRLEGDLRELLIEVPDGTDELGDSLAIDGWLDLHDFALGFLEPDYVFSSLLAGELRRVAEVGWMEWEWRTVRVQLIQFRDEEELHSITFLTDQQDTMEDMAGHSGVPLPDGLSGRYYLWDETVEEPGYLPYTLYTARILAHHQDVVLDIWINDIDREIGRQAATDLARDQLERL